MHLGVLDRLIDRKDETRRLRSRPQRVSLVDGGLPHARLKGVAHACGQGGGGGVRPLLRVTSPVVVRPIVIRVGVKTDLLQY